MFFSKKAFQSRGLGELTWGWDRHVLYHDVEIGPVIDYAASFAGFWNLAHDG
jgi:hypothetical protein